jgi:hypothetical protein
MCRPAPPDPAEGIIARLRGSAREKYNPWGVSHEGKLRGGGMSPPGGYPRVVNAGITSRANQASCSLNSFGPMPSAQWIIIWSRPGYFSSK